jgi:tRNA-dihydrouridine synthase C
MQLVLAPMEGLVDDIMRDVLTRIGGIDLCVTEFVRVTSALLPARTYRRLAPELTQGARTRAGTPVHVQLLGSDPAWLAANAARAVEWGAPAIDLNFGCPAKTVNQHRGGAALLDEPQLIFDIVRAVRAAMPAEVPLSAKMRLGFADKSPALDCARAIEAGGASRVTVHARTKEEGYRPPAHWEWIAKIREAVSIEVVANGEVWTRDDYRRIRAVSGCDAVMIGRGLIARPDLARCIRAEARGEPVAPFDWPMMKPWLVDFFRQCRERGDGSVYAVARLKQWLGLLQRGFIEAQACFAQVRGLRDADAIERLLCAAD